MSNLSVSIAVHGSVKLPWRVPRVLRASAFIITGLMGIAFMSFSGIKYGKDKPAEKTAVVDANK